jgi:hypothetical protein
VDVSFSDGVEELVLSQRGVVGAAVRQRMDSSCWLARVLVGQRQFHPRLFARLRLQLVERGVLVPDGNQLVFAQDYRFASPSTAAGVLVGGSANGRTSWKSTDRKTLKMVQAERAEARAEAG